MTNDTTPTSAQALLTVTDVTGAKLPVREEISRSGVQAEAAIASLRQAVQELHQSDDEAWRRYAVDLEEATRRFDTTVGIAAARLRAERAASKEELGAVVGDVVQSWRASADELRVWARLGEMDAHDRVVAAAADLDRASHHLSTVLTHLGSGVGASLSAMRGEVRGALDEVGSVFGGLRHRT